MGKMANTASANGWAGRSLKSEREGKGVGGSGRAEGMALNR